MTFSLCASYSNLLLRESLPKPVQAPETAKSLIVGIDDTYVKHREHLVALGARFVFVSSNPGWTERFFDGFLLLLAASGIRSMLAVRKRALRRERVTNHLVNHRSSKKQMRWSRRGAHYLWQVRAELLNGTLTDAYLWRIRVFVARLDLRKRCTDGPAPHLSSTPSNRGIHTSNASQYLHTNLAYGPTCECHHNGSREGGATSRSYVKLSLRSPKRTLSRMQC